MSRFNSWGCLPPVRAAALLAGLVLGCTAGPAPTAAEVVRQLYTVRRASHLTGAPATSELTAMTPYLSAELVTLLRQARALHDAEAARSPGDKPAFAEGDLFSSLFEGPTAWEVLADSVEGTSRRLAVRFTYEAEPPAVRWIDQVVVIRERGRLVVADVQYGGDWDFGNKGTLVTSLKAALLPVPTAR
jgi:hypothetical protein